jgi:predicted ATPase
LTARQGDLVILENPEAHIHPAGQRMLGELIAKVGAGGVQIFVETHSDHILNGIRISVKDKHIEKNDVQIAFFYKDNENKYRHTYMGLQIMEDGKLDHWPKGFFDEWENALIDLL